MAGSVSAPPGLGKPCRRAEGDEGGAGGEAASVSHKGTKAQRHKGAVATKSQHPFLGMRMRGAARRFYVPLRAFVPLCEPDFACGAARHGREGVKSVPGTDYGGAARDWILNAVPKSEIGIKSENGARH
jgi:hypothetical protein